MGFHGYFVSSTLATFYINEHTIVYNEFVFLSLLHGYPKYVATTALPCNLLFPFAGKDHPLEFTVVSLEKNSRHGVSFLILELLHVISDTHEYLWQLME